MRLPVHCVLLSQRDPSLSPTSPHLQRAPALATHPSSLVHSIAHSHAYTPHTHTFTHTLALPFTHSHTIMLTQPHAHTAALTLCTLGHPCMFSRLHTLSHEITLVLSLTCSHPITLMGRSAEPGRRVGGRGWPEASADSLLWVAEGRGSPSSEAWQFLNNLGWWLLSWREPVSCRESLVAGSL